MDQIQSHRFRMEYSMDKSLFREMIRGDLLANRLASILSLMTTLFLVFYFFLVGIYLKDMAEFSSGMLWLAVLLLFLDGIRLLMQRYSAGIGYRRILLTHEDTEPRVGLEFYDSYVVSLGLQNQSQTRFEYSQIQGVIETKNLLLLRLKYSTYLLVPKDCLRSQEAFLEFLLPKLRRQKLRSIRFGTFARSAKLAVIGILLAIALSLHPWIQLPQRLQGQIHSGLSSAEILDRLEQLGLSGFDREQVEYLDEFWMGAFYAGAPKLDQIMYYATLEDLDPETDAPTPSPANFTSFLFWANAEETMYTDLLNKLDAMIPEITITDIRETPAPQGIVTGTSNFSFRLNGTTHTLEATYDYDYYDPGVFDALSSILQEVTGKALYFGDCEGYGCWVFLGDHVWAEAFQSETGWSLTTDYMELYSQYVY